MPEELKSCRVCKKYVAEYASSCPHCGANHPADLDYSPVEAKFTEPVAKTSKPEPTLVEAPSEQTPTASGRLHRRGLFPPLSWFFWPPIHEAAYEGNIEAVKQHLKAGKDLNTKDEAGWTPLHMAADSGQKEVVELLITNGADLNPIDPQFGLTPLNLANQSDKPNASSCADLLRQHGGKMAVEIQSPVSSVSRAPSSTELPASKELFSTLETCKACGKPVSTDAKTCPQCGKKWPTTTSAVEGVIEGFFGGIGRLIVIVVVICIIILVIYLLSAPREFEFWFNPY